MKNRSFLHIKNWKSGNKSQYKSKTENSSALKVYKLIIDHENVDSDYWNQLHGTQDLVNIFHCHFKESDWEQLKIDLNNWTPRQLELFIQGILGYEAEKGTLTYATGGDVHIISDQTLLVPYIFDLFYTILKLSQEEGLNCGDLYDSVFEFNDDFLNNHFDIITNFDKSNFSKLKYILDYFIRISLNDERVIKLKEKIETTSREQIIKNDGGL